MKFSRSIFLAFLWVLLCVGCDRQDESSHKPDTSPAKVAQHLDEQQLNTIVLSEKAVERLGIKTIEVELVQVRRKRTYGGEVVVPPGQTIIVSAPVAGTLEAPEGTDIPVAGSRLSVGQPVLKFVPWLTAERDVLTPAEQIRVAQTKTDLATLQLDAERRIESARIELESAQIAYDRALELFKSRARSQRTVDEAEALLRLAREALETAEVRSKFLNEIQLDEEAGKIVPRTIEAPVSGVLHRMDVAPGETVAAGAPLFQIMKLDQVWIRVPVYVGDWHKIAAGQDASISEYGRPSDESIVSASPVDAPPSADPNASSMDLYYETQNEKHTLFPGQKVAATVTLREEEESLVVPWAAVIYDVHGNGWVYEQVEPRTYARRRIEVKYIEDDLAVLAGGPQPGSLVVTDGAAELYGTEFGAGK